MRFSQKIRWLTAVPAVLLLGLLLAGGAPLNSKGLYVHLQAENATKTLADAAAQAQKQGKELFLFGGEVTIDASLNISVPVSIGGGLCLNVEEGCTLTFENRLTAVPKTIFGGNGEVRFGLSAQEGYPQWFGAKGSGRDDTAAFQKAVDALPVLLIPDATYRLTDLIIDHPIQIRGIGAAKVYVAASNMTKRLFTVKSSQVSIENLEITLKDAPENSVCFYFDTDSTSMEDILLRNLWVSYARTGLCDAKNGTNRITDFTMEAVDFRTANGTQMDMYDFDKDLTLIEVTVTRREDLNNGIRVNMPAIIFRNINQMLVEHLDVNGDAHVSSITDRYNFDPQWVAQNLDGHGIIFENCHNVRMIRSLAEYVSGTGFIIKNCSGFDFENVQPYTFHTHGIYAENLTDSRFEILKACGNGDITLPIENLVFKNCNNLEFTGVLSCESRGDSLRLEGCSNMIFHSYMSVSGYKAALTDGGGNENVVFESFVSSLTKEAPKLTGNGITIKNAVIEDNTTYTVYPAE
ncbi:MAG: hypothetical protein IKD06_05795 [Clostridia bacterium]|nr:hypothetical protein [Clostridia bacterium]